MKLFLGIDTSCYTTSLAIVDGEGNLFSEARKILEVPAGGRGLAQNEAVFQHINNLPGLLHKVIGQPGFTGISGVCASIRPRPVEGSYMPVFRVADSFGRSVAALLGIPFTVTSHQEGHLQAGIWSAGGPTVDGFLAVHLSGGTTELLQVDKIAESGCSDRPLFAIKLMGGTTDLHAGQFIDRIGVALGLPFPAGPALEKLAISGDGAGKLTLPSSVTGYNLSFSGPETAALRLLEQEVPSDAVARAVEQCIANSLEKVLRKAVIDTGIKDVLIVGGVSANMYVRERLTDRLAHRAVGASLWFAGPGLSSDNAVGTALIGADKLMKSK